MTNGKSKQKTNQEPTAIHEKNKRLVTLTSADVRQIIEGTNQVEIKNHFSKYDWENPAVPAKEIELALTFLGEGGFKENLKRKLWQAIQINLEKAPRKCTGCGGGMWFGYCICDGDEYYCSDECLYRKYSIREWNNLYENTESYWTSWEDKDEEEEISETTPVKADELHIGYTSEEYCPYCNTDFDTHKIISPCPECGELITACNSCANCGTKCHNCTSGSNFIN